jgi:hypothetical protein
LPKKQGLGGWIGYSWRCSYVVSLIKCKKNCIDISDSSVLFFLLRMFLCPSCHYMIVTRVRTTCV